MKKQSFCPKFVWNLDWDHVRREGSVSRIKCYGPFPRLYRESSGPVQGLEVTSLDQRPSSATSTRALSPRGENTVTSRSPMFSVGERSATDPQRQTLIAAAVGSVQNLYKCLMQSILSKYKALLQRHSPVLRTKYLERMIYYYSVLSMTT